VIRLVVPDSTTGSMVAAVTLANEGRVDIRVVMIYFYSIISGSSPSVASISLKSSM